MPTARDIALVFLCLDAIVLSIIPLALFSALAYGVYRLHKAAKHYLRVAQGYARQVQDGADRVSQSIAKPVIGIHAQAHRLNTMVTHLVARRQP